MEPEKEPPIDTNGFTERTEKMIEEIAKSDRVLRDPDLEPLLPHQELLLQELSKSLRLPERPLILFDSIPERATTFRRLWQDTQRNINQVVLVSPEWNATSDSQGAPRSYRELLNRADYSEAEWRVLVHMLRGASKSKLLYDAYIEYMRDNPKSDIVMLGGDELHHAKRMIEDLKLSGEIGQPEPKEPERVKGTGWEQYDRQKVKKRARAVQSKVRKLTRKQRRK